MASGRLTGGVETRVLTHADADAYRRLRLCALRDHPDLFGRAYEEAQSAEEMVEELRTQHDGTRSFVLGAFESELVGIASCTREAGIKRRHKALIWGMYVAPEARGRGAGRRLLLDTIERARRWSGLTQVWLGVATHNDAAVTLYRSAGFEAFGLERRALRVGDRYVDEHHMVLHLDGGPEPGRADG